MVRLLYIFGFSLFFLVRSGRDVILSRGRFLWKVNHLSVSLTMQLRRRYIGSLEKRKKGKKKSGKYEVITLYRAARVNLKISRWVRLFQFLFFILYKFYISRRRGASLLFLIQLSVVTRLSCAKTTFSIYFKRTVHTRPDLYLYVIN